MARSENPDKPAGKLWSKQTVEERVRSALSAQQRLVEEIDPGATFLTHHNAVNNPTRFVYVDLNRHFLHVLETILEERGVRWDGETQRRESGKNGQHQEVGGHAGPVGQGPENR